MSEDRRLQLMQESLDIQLEPEDERELASILEDAVHAREYTALQQMDNMLRSAPHERAPERLALTIMARLGETAMQTRTDIEQEPEVNEALLQVALSLVTAATLPLMVGASYLLINAMSNPEALESVLVQVAGLFLLVIDTVRVMLEKAQEAAAENPEAALAMITLIPMVLLELVKQVLGVEDEHDIE